MSHCYKDRYGYFHIAIKQSIWNYLFNAVPPEYRDFAEETELCKQGFVVMRRMGLCYFYPSETEDGRVRDSWISACLSLGYTDAVAPPRVDISTTKFAVLCNAFGKCWHGSEYPDAVYFGTQAYEEYRKLFGVGDHRYRFNGVPIYIDPALRSMDVRLVNSKFPGNPSYNTEITI